MTSTTQGEAALLERLVRRLGPYVKDGTLRRTRLDGVLAGLARGDHETEALRGRVIAALGAAGIDLVDDRQLSPTAAPATDSPSASEVAAMARASAVEAPALADEEPPGEELDVHEERVQVPQAIAAARRLLARAFIGGAAGGRVLTAEEEVGLAALMRGGAYRLSEDLPGDFRRGLEAGSEAAKAFDALVIHNIRLTWSIAQRYFGSSPHLEPEDLVGYGYEGLIRAVRKFDATLGFKFSTYATWWVRQAITRNLHDYGRTIRIPVHVSEKISRTRNAIQRLEARGMRASTPALCQETGYQPEEIENHFRWMRGVYSLDAPVGAEEELRLADLLVADPASSDPVEWAELRWLRESVVQTLGRLSAREGRVIVRRFGLDGSEPATLDEIGQEFGVTRERIRQILGKTMSKLRHPEMVSRLNGRHVPRSPEGRKPLQYQDAGEDVRGRAARPVVKGRASRGILPRTTSGIRAVEKALATVARLTSAEPAEAFLFVVYWTEWGDVPAELIEQRLNAYLAERSGHGGDVGHAAAKAVNRGWIVVAEADGIWQTTPAGRRFVQARLRQMNTAPQ